MRDDVAWQCSPLREFLVKAFDRGAIPLECGSTTGPSGVHDLTKNESVMKDVACDEVFVRRLHSLSQQIVGTADRAMADREACDNFVANHPRPTHNMRGEPRWEGSLAQKHLKKDMEDGRHFRPDGSRLAPAEFRCLRPHHQEHFLATMRGHIDQETRLQNFNNCLEDKQKKPDAKKRKVEAKAKKDQST